MGVLFGPSLPRIYRACKQPSLVDLHAAHQPEGFPMTPEIRMVAVDSKANCPLAQSHALIRAGDDYADLFTLALGMRVLFG